MTRVHQSLLALGASALLALGTTGCGSITADEASSGGSGGGSGGGKAGSATEAHDDPAALDGRTFVSTEINRSGDLPGYLSDARVRLSFEENARTITAEAGCNGMFGDVRANGGTLTVESVGGTEMACEKRLMRQDDWLRGLLQSDPSWNLDDGELTITADDTEVVLRERDTGDVTALRGTTWSLRSMAETGEGSEGPVRGGPAVREVELRFVEPERDTDAGGDSGSETAAPDDSTGSESTGSESTGSDSTGSEQQSPPGDPGDSTESEQQSRPGAPDDSASSADQGESDAQGSGEQGSGEQGSDAQGSDAQGSDAQGPDEQRESDRQGKAQGPRVEGDGGCNGFGGPATLVGSDRSEYDGAIRFGSIARTLKACPDENVMRVEQRLLDTLQGTVPYTVEDDELTLYGEKYELRFAAGSTN